MSRLQWILAAVLAVQAALLLVLYAGADATDAVDRVPLLEGLTGSDPSRIRIDSGEDGGSIVLSRQGASWTLSEPAGYPADGAQVDHLLNDLGSILVRRPVATSGRYHDALGVGEEEFERRIRIWTGDGEPVHDLYLGSSANYRVYHVRAAADHRVFEQNRVTPYDLRPDPASWVVQELFDLPVTAVTTAVRLENRNGSMELDLTDGAWSVKPPPPGGRQPDRRTVDSWVRSLVTLRMKEPAGPVDDAAHGYTEPAAVLEMRYRVESAPPEDGDVEGEPAPEVQTGVVRLVVGAETGAEGGSRYARVGDSPFSVILSNWEAKKLTDKKPDDLVDEET